MRRLPLQPVRRLRRPQGDPGRGRGLPAARPRRAPSPPRGSRRRVRRGRGRARRPQPVGTDADGLRRRRALRSSSTSSKASGDSRGRADPAAGRPARRRGRLRPFDRRCRAPGNRACAGDGPHRRAVPAQEIPSRSIAERVADRAGDTSYVLAAKLPALRDAVCQQIVSRFARQNGILGAAIFIPGADFPVLTLEPDPHGAAPRGRPRRGDRRQARGRAAREWWARGSVSARSHARP